MRTICHNLIVPLLVLPGLALDGSTERVSVSDALVQGNAASGTGPGRTTAVSADGRVIAFLSQASNLVPGDTNNVRDAFVRDLDTNVTERVSVNTIEVQVDRDVTSVHLSGDGRYVLFTTASDNIAIFDSNDTDDVFLRDRVAGTTTLVSRTATGIPGDGTSLSGYLSDDGRYAVFFSTASNLVPGDTNGEGDVFRFDRTTGSVEKVSTDNVGTQANASSRDPHISGDGRWVVFTTSATNIYGALTSPEDDIILRDMVTGLAGRLGPLLFEVQWDADPFRPTVSNGGQYVAFESTATNIVDGDTNGVPDVFLYDTSTDVARRISLAPNSLPADGPSGDALITQDGSAVVFSSQATNLVAGDTNAWQDIFVAQLDPFTITRASINGGGVESNSFSGKGAISGNGSRVAFTSAGNNLAPGDSNSAYDVFAHLRGPLTPIYYCSNGQNSLGCSPELAWIGVPSATAGSGFEIVCFDVLNQQFGVLIYSTTGAQESPFGNQHLCIQPPIYRTTPQHSGGNLQGSDCSGVLRFDFNTWIASGVDANLTVGTTVWSQFWSRDPGVPSPNGFFLSQGLSFVIGG